MPAVPYVCSRCKLTVETLYGPPKVGPCINNQAHVWMRQTEATRNRATYLDDIEKRIWSIGEAIGVLYWAVLFIGIYIAIFNWYISIPLFLLYYFWAKNRGVQVDIWKMIQVICLVMAGLTLLPVYVGILGCFSIIPLTILFLYWITRNKGAENDARMD